MKRILLRASCGRLLLLAIAAGAALVATRLVDVHRYREPVTRAVSGRVDAPLLLADGPHGLREGGR